VKRVSLILLLCAQLPLAAQNRRAAVSVPFVGCPSDGQVGPAGAPQGKPVPVPVNADAAHALAYYKSAQGVGVLAPRGWHCFATYGSSGDTLYVSPEPMDTRNILSPERTRFAGPVIQATIRFGETSGRFSVAEIAARVFPAYKSFVAGVIRSFDQQPENFPFGPHPADILTYKGKSVAQYRTPANSDGLGTYSWLEKNGSPIDGVAILAGEPPNLLLIAVRLPADRAALAPAIIAQFERDAAR
jgi:hypothetical protein